MSEHTVPAAPGSGDARREVERLRDLVAEFRKRDEVATRVIERPKRERDALQRQVDAVKALCDEAEVAHDAGGGLRVLARMDVSRVRAALSGGDTPACDGWMCESKHDHPRPSGDTPDGPRCRYCGADCSGGRSWDGGDLYACGPCSNARAARNCAIASAAKFTAYINAMHENVKALLRRRLPRPPRPREGTAPMSEWVQITCQEREALIDRLGRSYNGFAQESGVGVHASSTDMSPGGLVFTEWGYRNGDERPVLRDYRWNDCEQPCEHYVPADPEKGQHR